MQKGRARVETVAAVMQQPGYRQVDQHADERDQHHRSAHHRLRIGQAVDGLDDDERDQAQHQQAVEQRGENFQAHQAVGVSIRRRLARQPGSQCGQAQGGGVGDHVAGIGQQRQRAGPEPGDHFDHREGEREEQRLEQGIAAMLVANVVLRLRGIAIERDAFGRDGGFAVFAHPLLPQVLVGSVRASSASIWPTPPRWCSESM